MKRGEEVRIKYFAVTFACGIAKRHRLNLSRLVMPVISLMKFAFPLFATLVCAVVPAVAIPVSVTVVGPDGKPLPNAKLSVSEGKLADSSMREARAQSGRDGSFVWEWDGQFGLVNADLLERDFRAALGIDGLLRVKAMAPGMVAETRLLQEGQTTIRLQPARAWSGLVLDQNQKPVAGVTLKLEGVQPPEVIRSGRLVNRYLDPFLSVEDAIALTNDEGRWSLLGLPARGNAQILVADERFATQKLSLLIGEGDAAPIVLQQSATITGVLLAPDGTPLEGGTVRAGFGPYSITTTDREGRFTIAGLEAGKVTPYLDSLSSVIPTTDGLPDFLFEKPESVEMEAGKTLDLGKISGRKGVLIKARIVDAETKKPLSNATLNADYKWQVRTSMGKDGQLQARLLKPSIIGLSDKFEIKSEGYADYPLSVLPPKIADSVAVDFGTIEMKRGTIVRGTVGIEGGGDLGRLPTIALNQGDKSEYLRPDASGKIESKILGAGAYKAEVFGSRGIWELAAPVEIVVPAKGGDIAPVEITLKRLKPYEPLVRELRGRLLSSEGKPIAGATVRARFKSEGESFFFTKASALSNANGDFQLASREPNKNIVIEWDGAEHPEYLIGGEPIIKVSDGIATISGLTSKKRGAIFAGRVTDAQGNPATKAWIAVAEARDYPPVPTGADGKFELVDVPLENFTLVIAQGHAWTMRPAQSDKSGIAVRLPDAPAMPSAESLSRQLVAIQDGVNWADVNENWDVLGTPLIERFLRRNGQPRAEVMAQFGAELARRDGAQLLRRAPEFVENTEGEARQDLLAQLNLVRAQIGDADERAAANDWLDEQKPIKREINARSVTRLLQMAAVAQKLKRPDASQSLDYAIAVATQLGENSGSQWAEALAALGYDATALFAAERDARAEFTLWGYVGPMLAQNGDIAGARRALSRLETLALDPALVKAQDSELWRLSPRRIDEMREQVAGALAPTDARGALQLALQNQNDSMRARALLEVAEGARSGGQTEVAEEALRAMLKLPAGDGKTLAGAAAIGAQIRPQLGDEFFAAARKAALPDANNRSAFMAPSIGLWAYHYAAIDPAQSRVLIEREWNWRLPAAIKSDKEGISFIETGALNDLVRAMAVIDGERATTLQAAVDAAGLKNYRGKTSLFNRTVIALSSAEQNARLDAVAQ